MRRLGMLQPTREQVVPNQWQLVAGMKAADRSHLTNVLRMVSGAGGGLRSARYQGRDACPNNSVARRIGLPLSSCWA